MKLYLTLPQANELILLGLSEKYSSTHFTTLSENKEPSYYSAEMNTQDTWKYKYPTFTVTDLQSFLLEKGYTLCCVPFPKTGEIGVNCYGSASTYSAIKKELIDALFHCVKRHFGIKNKKNDIPRK